MENKLKPKLRFPGFEEEWSEKKYKEIITANRLGGNYDNFDDISKFPLIKMGNIGRGKIILGKIQYLKCAENINNEDILKKGDLLFNTRNTLDLVGKVAIWNNELDFALYNSNLMRMTFDSNIIEASNLFMNSLFNQLKTIKQLRAIATGTTSVAAIYNKDLNNIKFLIPSLSEQQKIADYLSTIDKKITLLEEKKEELSRYKKAMMQKLFSQEIRFKDENGNNFPEWDCVQLKDILVEHKEKNKGNKYSEVLSVAKEKGVINQIEHLGRSYSAENIEHYKVINPFDVVYTKSPTSGFPFGIIKQNKLGRSGVLSPLYAVFKPKTKYLGMILHDLFLSEVETYNYLVPLVQKGAKNTMNINNDDFLNGRKYFLPSEMKEQQKIADFLSAIDNSIEKVKEQIEQTQAFKKAMLQKMFV